MSKRGFDKQVQYQRLMNRLALMKDTRVLKYIDKPDPVVETFSQVLRRKIFALIRVKT